MGPLRVAELFAGVGGFRYGLEKANQEVGSRAFEVVWSNQWEPSTKVQHASEVYKRVFGSKGHSNEDISTVAAEALPDIDLLVGGFPCQDYSVATTLQRSGGLQGKKGVLWWEIHRLLRDKSPRPPLLFLENVDRLLKSPSQQRGRDFAVMLASLADLGYAVEWRVVNAADYGMPQRRRRIFILGYLKGSRSFDRLIEEEPLEWLSQSGVMANAFPAKPVQPLFVPRFSLDGDLVEITNSFNNDVDRHRVFANAGLMVGREVTTYNLEPDYNGPTTNLRDVLVAEREVPEEFFINGSLEEWRFLKGAKVIDRVSKTSGHRYQYSEGAMVFPDALDRPSRTIITGEGGPTPSRFKHVVETESRRHRRLLPIELERLNMFPNEYSERVSDIKGLTDAKRAFLMGNSLVTGIVTRVGVELARRFAAPSISMFQIDAASPPTHVVSTD